MLDPSRPTGTRAYGNSRQPTDEEAMPEITTEASSSEAASLPAIRHNCSRRKFAKTVSLAVVPPGAQLNPLTPEATRLSSITLPVAASTRRRRKEVVPQSQLKNSVILCLFVRNSVGMQCTRPPQIVLNV